MRKQLLLFILLFLFLSLACGSVTITGGDDGVPTIAPTAEPAEEREEETSSPRNLDGSGLPPTFTPAPTLPVPTLLPIRTTPTTDPGSIAIYVVQSGDTLREIADSFGVTVEEVAALNGISNIDVIEVGQELQIPIR